MSKTYEYISMNVIDMVKGNGLQYRVQFVYPDRKIDITVSGTIEQVKKLDEDIWG